MDKRYFEFVEGTSSKFWEVWMDGTQVFTRYGKIGSGGQTTIKDEGSDEKAQKLHDKLVNEKTRKGYEEKGGGKAAAAPAKAAAPAVKAAKASAPPPPPKKAAAAPAAAPAAGGFRRFEFVEGSSAKFWEVKLDGSEQTIRFGKIGTLGQEKTKNLGSADAAQSDTDKLIAEKTKKGYAPVAAAPSGPPPPELDPKELEKHLAEIPEGASGPEPFLVFADWLQSKDHPWGKLITIQHGIATAANAGKRSELEKEEKALLREYGDAIVGGLQKTKGTEFTWHYGFIKRATLGSPTAKPVIGDNLETLLELPAARLMDAVVLDPMPTEFATQRDWDNSNQNIANVWGPVLKALKLPDQIKHVGFGSNPPSSASAYVQLPDLKEVSKAAAKVESLELTGCANGEVGSLNLPNLKSLEVRFSNASGADLSAIRDSKLPKLERLAVWLGGNSNCILDDVYPPDDDRDEDDSGYPDTFKPGDLDAMEIYDINSDINPEAVANFLAGKFPDSMKHLGLKSAALSAEMIEAIVNGPVLKQLESLDLSEGNLKDETAKALAAAKKKLAHLKALNLENNCLSKEGAKKLSADLPNAKTGAQRTDGSPAFFFRYVATME